MLFIVRDLVASHPLFLPDEFTVSLLHEGKSLYDIVKARFLSDREDMVWIVRKNGISVASNRVVVYQHM